MESERRVQYAGGFYAISIKVINGVRQLIVKEIISNIDLGVHPNLDQRVSKAGCQLELLSHYRSYAISNIVSAAMV